MKILDQNFFLRCSDLFHAFYMPCLCHVFRFDHHNPSMTLGFKFQVLPKKEGALNLWYREVQERPTVHRGQWHLKNERSV